MMKAVIGDTIFTGTLLVGCSFLYFSTKDTCTQSAFVFAQIVKASLNNQVKVKNKCTVKLPDLLKSNCVTDEKESPYSTVEIVLNLEQIRTNTNHGFL